MQRSRIAMALLGACLALLVGSGCASGPRYGAARKSRKGCDCPHWNALPKRGPDGARSWVPRPVITAHDAGRH